MKRIIKLRIPIFENGKFYKFNYHEIEVGVNSYSFGSCIFLGGYEIKEPQQFTGAKDINDKEVYDGDILIYEYNGILQKVYWSSTGYGWFCQYLGKPNDRSSLSSSLFFNSKVVGNIHERPELLNDIPIPIR